MSGQNPSSQARPDVRYARSHSRSDRSGCTGRGWSRSDFPDIGTPNAVEKALQIVRQLCRRGVAICRITLQATQADVLQIDRQVAAQLPRRQRIVLLHMQQNLRNAAALQRRRHTRLRLAFPERSCFNPGGTCSTFPA